MKNWFWLGVLALCFLGGYLVEGFWHPTLREEFYFAYFGALLMGYVWTASLQADIRCVERKLDDVTKCIGTGQDQTESLREILETVREIRLQVERN